MALEKIIASAVVVNPHTRQVKTVEVEVTGITADGVISVEEETKVANEIYQRGLVGDWQVTDVTLQERKIEGPTYERIRKNDGSSFERVESGSWVDVGERQPFHLSGAAQFFAPRPEFQKKWIPRQNRDGYQIWQEGENGRLARVPLGGGQVELDVSDGHGPGWTPAKADDGVPLLVPVQNDKLLPWPVAETSGSTDTATSNAGQDTISHKNAPVRRKARGANHGVEDPFRISSW